MDHTMCVCVCVCVQLSLILMCAVYVHQLVLMSILFCHKRGISSTDTNVILK